MMLYKMRLETWIAQTEATMEPLMTPEEVAELLRIDVAVVLRLAERDELPSFLFEDQRRFSRAEMARFLARGQSVGASESYRQDIDTAGFASDHFNKFTERARKVLSLAQEEAQRFQHNYIGTEHLLLGLVREGDGVAAKVLNNLGINLGDARAAVEHIIGRGDRVVLGEIGLTPRAKKVIELAVDEAARLGHHYIGTEHLLLGLIREGEGIAAGVLESLGVNLERARRETIKVLTQRDGNGNA
jgi:excisionase family DNA binding protein